MHFGFSVFSDTTDLGGSISADPVFSETLRYVAVRKKRRMLAGGIYLFPAES